MSNQNGQLVLKTLQNLDEPSTLLKISKKIADTVGADINDVKDSVKATLDGGVQYGYVQRLNRKYFTAPIEIGELDDSEPNDTQDMDVSKELQDRPARRRRARGRRSSRRRVGSRRRRRSRR